MAGVIFFDIHPPDDPNGTPLCTLSDDDLAAGGILIEENALGSGQFTIRKDHALATEANLATGNYVKVRIPQIQTDPVFGFWLDESDDTLVSESEESEEELTRGGPGILFILAFSRLLNTFYNGSLGGNARGNYDVPGYWTWATEPYGAIMVRLIEEGQLEPGQPLTDVSIDWNRTFDSDAVDWPTVNELIQFDIGTDGLTVFARLIESGELFVRPEPDLTVKAYVNRGDDLTGTSYGAGVVRFVKHGVSAEDGNILTEVKRGGHGVAAATHAIVVGKDYTYRQVVSPDYAGPPGRWTTKNYGNSNDPDLLDKVGLEDLRRRQADQNGIELEFNAGNDPNNGRYFPFVDFRTGDLVTLHTGSGEWDYTNAPHYVVGFKIDLPDTTDDATDELAAKSLRWVVQLNAAPYQQTTRNTPTLPDGKPCSDCPPPPPRPPFVPGNRPPDYVFDDCTTINIDADRSTAMGIPPGTDTEGTWYYLVENTAHEVASWTSDGFIRWDEGGTTDDNFIATQYAYNINGAAQGTPFTGPWGPLPDTSGTIVIGPGGNGLMLHTNQDGYAAPYSPPFDEDCYRFSLWKGGAPGVRPQVGQMTSEAIAGDSPGTDFPLNYPYHSGSLQVWVADTATSSGVLVVPTEVDLDDGTFELGFDSTGKTLTVVYQVRSTTPTGATNPAPSPTDTL